MIDQVWDRIVKGEASKEDYKKIKEFIDVKSKKKLLTAREKQYLEDIIRPFVKLPVTVTIVENIRHCYLDIKVDFYHIEFPYFDKGRIYCGLSTDYEYSIQELGLYD